MSELDDDVIGQPEIIQEPELPGNLAAQAVDFWELQLRTIDALAGEVANEYTSKIRLRTIAALALAQLNAMTLAQKAVDDVAEAEKKKESGLILPQTGLILP